MVKFGALNAFTLRLAIGAVWLVATFLSVCGVYNIFPFVEGLARSSTWSALVALPVLVVSYALGTIVTNASLVFGISRKDRRDQIMSLVSLSHLATPAVLSRLEALRIEAEFLRALVPTVVFLSASVLWSSVRILGGGILLACVVAALILVSSVPVVVHLVQRVDEQSRWLVDAAYEQAPKVEVTSTPPNRRFEPDIRPRGDNPSV